MLPWIEKYRPTSLSEVVGNNEAVGKLQVILENKSIPNMIISGPPGSGKTSSISCMAKKLLGDCAKDAVLELNASDERGIDTVRKTIKMFCKKQINNLPTNCHKLVLLDEADNMTPSAQQSLRRIIENYASTTRFMFACNNSSRIIEAIQSRCVTMKFYHLTEDQITDRLIDICNKENVKYTKDGIDALIFISDGDMRQILNNAQAIACNYSLINADNVYCICDKPHPEEMRQVIDYIVQGNHVQAQCLVSKVYRKGYSVVDILDTLFKVIKKNDNLDKVVKMFFVQEISMMHMYVTKGLDTLIQLNALIARLCLCVIRRSNTITNENDYCSESDSDCSLDDGQVEYNKNSDDDDDDEIDDNGGLNDEDEEEICEDYF
jgi:replication factor C subunit 2/4